MMRSAIALLLTVCLLGALPASDDFDRTNEDPMSTAGSWSTAPGCGLPRIESQQVIGSITTGTYPQGVYWDADAFDDDQYITFTTAGASAIGGGAIRINGTTTANCYLVSARNSTTLRIYKIVDDTATQLGSDVATVGFDTDSVLKLTASGTIIELFQDDLSLTSLSDATHASGSAGLMMAASKAVDNWVAGNLSAGASKVPVMMGYYRRMR